MPHSQWRGMAIPKERTEVVSSGFTSMALCTPAGFPTIEQ